MNPFKMLEGMRMAISVGPMHVCLQPPKVSPCLTVMAGRDTFCMQQCEIQSRYSNLRPHTIEKQVFKLYQKSKYTPLLVYYMWINICLDLFRVN